MPIRRTNKNNQKKWLKENSHLKILDLGSTHVNYWREANHFADIVDYREHFKKLNLPYTQITPNDDLPFKDKEFDYVICSHVLEHVPDPFKLKAEIERVGKAGYIELPTKLNDNTVFGCDEEVLGHKWWFEFDDDKQNLVFAKKIDALEKFLSVGSIFKLIDIFQDSFILQFYWSDTIPMTKREPFVLEKKITFLSLVKKFYSKKIRQFFSNLKKKFNK
jgi:SAM-dependent methyltransferase